MVLSHRFGKVVIEVRYPASWSLVDRKGAAAEALVNSLGGSFLVDLHPDHLDLRTETIAVRCGAANFSVEQTAPETIVVAEDLATRVWQCLTTKVGIPKSVLRVGTRFITWWEVSDEAHAWRVLRGTGLAKVPEAWRRVFGDVERSAAIALPSLGERTSGRIALDVAHNIVSLPFPNAALLARAREHAPEWAVQLDVDVGTAAVDAYRLMHDELRSMIRDHWDHVAPWIERLDVLLRGFRDA